MLLGEALVARALADQGIAAIVADRVTWVDRPQGSALPALVLETISGDRPEDLDGEPSMRTTRVQASCFSATKKDGGGGYAEARALAEAAIAALQPEAEIGAIVFWRATATEPRDGGEQTDTGFVFHVTTDLIIRWQKV